MDYKHLIGETITLELSGNLEITGVLVDISNDLMVVFDSKDYLYIPRIHIHHFKREDDSDKQIFPADIEYKQDEGISLRKTLVNANGLFSEILLMKHNPIYGYVVSVMNDYLLFYSPVYKHIYISLNHIKWLIPLPFNQIPYGIDIEKVPFNPSNIPLSRTFEEQIEKFVGKIAVFDLGNKPHKTGLIKKISDHTIELITARSEMYYLNLRHINSFHS
ncbi:DUF2642 domain-containing protein [Neobacillus mesonae]|uniref:DUF2642 domain-containing protein n=1 Tax=Neobacillus mesonae TaxID=1193713 RepID=UPI00203E9555|nr:DUF2642 domain-containing protein [Neobacillus mesonae]MCM3569479.1 DUF2642 domain-containing protein [Neobacillus mesonae]